MTEMTEQVRETFRTVGDEIAVPAFDEVAFRGQVRRARRGRTGRLSVGVAVAAGVAAVAMTAVPPLLEAGGGRRDVGAAGSPSPAVTPAAQPEPLYYLTDTRLMAATPDGEVHDLGRFESIVGSTAEGVLAVDGRGVPVWIGASSAGEGDGVFTFERGSGPVVLPATGPVQSMALSADGRYLGWLTSEDEVRMWDLKAEQMIHSVDVGRNAYVASVSDRGTLVSLDGELTLIGAALDDVEVPTEADGYGAVADTAADLVTVADRDDVTRVYDVTDVGRGRTATLVDSVPGTGRLAPYAAGIVSVDGSTVRLWPADGEPGEPAGLEGVPQIAGWLDEDYAVVTTAESGGTSVFLCAVEEMSCTRVVHSGAEVRLAE